MAGSDIPCMSQFHPSPNEQHLMTGLGLYPISGPRRPFLGTIISTIRHMGDPRLLEDTIE